MLADGLSRWKMDRGDYTLKKCIFQQILRIFGVKDFWPKVDMFASPGNTQLKNYVCRWPHSGAVAVNALECNLEKFSHVYANPPWNLILQWLIRLKQNPQIMCLTVVPLWVGSIWWPLLTRLHVKSFPVLKILPTWGMFSNCLGEEMPPPPSGPFFV